MRILLCILSLLVSIANMAVGDDQICNRTINAKGSLIAESQLMYLMRIHCELVPESKELLFMDSVLAYEPLRKFPINEKTDTVYIESSYIDEGRVTGVVIWNKECYLPIFHGIWRNNKSYLEKTEKIIKREKNYFELVNNWETKVLKRIGDEFYARCMVSPGCVYYLTRMILHNGVQRIDTTRYHRLGNINELTAFQLDSIRQCVAALPPEKLSDREAPVSIGQEKESCTEPKAAPKSIWQRIVDWFSNLWRSIFG